ncbi:MAG: hypothetical protein KF726_22650 [Anaerolineae bacterium]|nr:hypothetical protein [Anaerolineae bacterium]
MSVTYDYGMVIVRALPMAGDCRYYWNIRRLLATLRTLRTVEQSEDRGGTYKIRQGRGALVVGGRIGRWHRWRRSGADRD